MKIETRYQPHRSVKGEGITETSWGKYYREQKLNPYIKNILYCKTLLRGLAVLSEEDLSEMYFV